MTAPLPLHRPPAFPDRESAGRTLAARIERLRVEAPVVLAISRGGLPVGHQVARSLGAPLDVLVVRRVGEPGRWVGAVAEDGTAVIDHDLAQLFGTAGAEVAEQRERAQAGAADRARFYRAGREPLEFVGRTVVLVDDAVTAWPTALVAVRAALRRGAGRVVIAAPVLGSSAVARLGHEADELVSLGLPSALPWCREPAGITDSGVAALLSGLRLDAGEPQRVSIPLAGSSPLPGELTVPEGARGAIVVGATDQIVAAALEDAGFSTLRLRLPRDGAAVRALAVALGWLRTIDAARNLPLGIFGAGHGATAALAVAAADDGVRAVVGAGAGPGLSRIDLAEVHAAALLVVGGEDGLALRLNRSARGRLGGESRVAVVAGAGSGLSEPGSREQVAHLATEWFARHL